LIQEVFSRQGQSLHAASTVLAKVNSLWLNPRILIALHSPCALLETRLRMCLPEKTVKKRPTARAVRSLQSGLPLNNREILALSRISAQNKRNSSAVETAWRSAQSGANLSPVKFPANRENNREFSQF
jgi:hypothetical protein